MEQKIILFTTKQKISRSFAVYHIPPSSMSGTQKEQQAQLSQRETYKMIDKFLSSGFTSTDELFKILITDVCNREEFAITGGRVWEIDELNETYHLLYQYGDVDHIPDDYSIPVKDQPVFTMLAERRSVTNIETDSLLLEKGIRLYSATGVGDMVRLSSGRYYRYVLAFNAPEMKQELFSTITIIGSATTTALRNMRMRSVQEKMKKDLDQASAIQRSLLPDHTLEFSDYSVFGISLPDSVVGGDYFDYLKPTDQEDEDRAGIVISDAASKGLPAAVQALFVSGAMRMGISYHTKISSLISRLNTLIYDTFPFERFVTLFYCELTLSENGLVLYANAGHCSPIHFEASTYECHNLDPTGGILGIAPHQKFQVNSINMKEGDILLLYTDGISEAQNEHGEQFGMRRLKDFLREHRHENSKELAYNLLEDIQKFSIGANYTDDKTLVVIKRVKSSKQS